MSAMQDPWDREKRELRMRLWKRERLIGAETGMTFLAGAIVIPSIGAPRLVAVRVIDFCRSEPRMNSTGTCGVPSSDGETAPAAVEPHTALTGEQEREAIHQLLAEHSRQLETNEHAYFELAYTRQTGWMAWLTDKPARGEPGTVEYARSRRVIARGQGETPDEACADALAALSASKEPRDGR